MIEVLKNIYFYNNINNSSKLIIQFDKNKIMQL